MTPYINSLVILAQYALSLALLFYLYQTSCLNMTILSRPLKNQTINLQLNCGLYRKKRDLHVADLRADLGDLRVTQFKLSLQLIPHYLRIEQGRTSYYNP